MDRRYHRGISVFLAAVLLLALLAVAVSSCGSSTPTTYTPPATSDFSNLTWTQAFQKLNDKFAREYAFTTWKGLDWKAIYKKFAPRIARAQSQQDVKSYYLTLREYIQQMRDGHVSLKGDDLDLPQALAGGGFGMTVLKLDDGRVVANWVAGGGPAAAAGIKAGAQIITWGGKPVSTALAQTSTVLAPPMPTDGRVEAERLRYLVRAPVGTQKAVNFSNDPVDQGARARQSATLTAVDDQGEGLARSAVTISTPTAPGADSTVQQQMLPGNIGYIRVYVEVDNPESAPGDHTPTLTQFRNAVNGFIDARATGMVIDIRSNHGGSDQMVCDFMASFYNNKTFYEYQNYIVPSTGQFQIWVADDVTGEYSKPGQGLSIVPGSKRYTGPVVALVDNTCISSGEGVAMGIKNLPNSKVVGILGTNGSFGMVGDGAAMPGGYEIGFPFGQSLDQNKSVQVDSRNGRGGVTPNARVPMTLQNALDLANGKDVTTACRY